MDETNDGQPQFFVTPGYGEKARDTLHYSQAVRVGNRVEISGQGGWDDEMTIAESLEDEIVLAFDNVERVLASAGASWPDVIQVNSYHLPVGDVIGQEDNRIMVEQFRRRLGGRAPIWTQTGTPAFGIAGMRVEIRVTAIVESDS